MKVIAPAQPKPPSARRASGDRAPSGVQGLGEIVLSDPLDPDRPDDDLVLTTRRAIPRFGLVVLDTFGRFERADVEYGAMSWMPADTRKVDGAAAIDARLCRDACKHGFPVHEPGLGMDAERYAVDALMSDDDDDFDEREFEHLYASGNAGVRRSRRVSRRAIGVRLYTATIASTRDNTMLQAFHASIASNAGEVRSRLVRRFGADLAKMADIRPGVHPAMPLVVALVPDAVVELLVRVQRECTASGTKTFAVDIQQWIQA